MIKSWEELARELEKECLKAKEALEEAWEEIEQLRDTNVNQRDEITVLKHQLTLHATQKPETTGSEHFLAIAAEPFNSITSQWRSPFQFGVNQTNGSDIGMRDQWPQQFKILPDDKNEKLPCRANLDFFPTSSLAFSKRLPDEGSYELKELQAKVEERDGRIEHLESELEKITSAMSIALEHKEHELERLKNENSYREEKMINLQSQLAGYMLKETSMQNIGSANNSKASTCASSQSLISYVLQCPVNDDDGNDSLTFRDIDSDLPCQSKRSAPLNRSMSFRIPSVTSLCRPIPRILSRSQSQRDVEAELLRQLDFVQEEKRMDMRELENKIQDLDATIKRCHRTISIQEETIQHLQHLVEDLKWKS